MSTTWLIADTVYPDFVDSVYAAEPALHARSYDEQLEALLARAFGASNFYSRHLRELGHEAVDVLMNVPRLQNAWLEEHAVAGPRAGGRALMRALEEQVRDVRPDVLLLLDMAYLPDSFLNHLARLVPVVVGQVAAPLDFSRDFTPYGLVVSSLPHFVERFRAAGVRSELVPLAFESSLVDCVGAVERSHDVAFVGSLDPNHSGGNALLNTLLEQVPLQIWAPRGQAAQIVAEHRAAYRGEAWGLEMYNVLAASRIVVNRHIDVAEGRANNLRMFEATGMGACLVTEAAPNLADLFEPGVEVVTYTSPEDCAAQVLALLQDPVRLAAVAERGRRRTLADHSYARRVGQLADLVAAVPPRPTSFPTKRWRSLEIIAKDVLRPLKHRIRDRLRRDVSSGHTAIAPVTAEHELAQGWTTQAVAVGQRVVVDDALARMRRGERVIEFDTAAAAIGATALHRPSLLEVGCASAYYATALRELGVEVRYTGLDYSLALLAQARRHEAALPVVAGDGAALPFAAGAFEVVLSGCVLLHMPAWKPALAESFRVASDFVVLHRTPVTSGSTSYLTKKAYGVDVVELVFSEAELLAEVAASGGTVVREWLIDRYELDAIGSPIEMKTYLIACGATS
jgi:spore maturation protein CgeB